LRLIVAACPLVILALIRSPSRAGSAVSRVVLSRFRVPGRYRARGRRAVAATAMTAATSSAEPAWRISRSGRAAPLGTVARYAPNPAAKSSARVTASEYRGVSVTPGSTRTTDTPNGASSARMASDSASRANLLAE